MYGSAADDPVLFSLPGLNQNTDSNNSGFNSAPAQAGEDGDLMPYKIPPALWMIVFIIIGYVGIRWIMED